MNKWAWMSLGMVIVNFILFFIAARAKRQSAIGGGR